MNMKAMRNVRSNFYHVSCLSCFLQPDKPEMLISNSIAVGLEILFYLKMQDN
jgi:hypothetical protein